MITKFENFINEDIKTPLKKYFVKNSLKHENMIGKRVITQDGDVWYISNIDPIHDITSLPYQIYCSKKPNSEFGKYIKTEELYIPDDVDLGVQSQQVQQVQAQSQVQSIQESDQTVAKEILNQLGSNKFRVMTGAKNFASTENSLSFRIPMSKSINYIKIILTSLDLYEVEYGRIFGDKYTVVNNEEGLYADMLVKSFEKNTGLYTKLY